MPLITYQCPKGIGKSLLSSTFNLDQLNVKPIGLYSMFKLITHIYRVANAINVISHETQQSCTYVLIELVGLCKVVLMI